MENSYYLSEGHILGGHYEIVKILGEDEFEILYLVKDTHRLDSLFVIKELFLKAYARRENESVQVMAKSKLLFEDTKKEMIDEIIMAQKKGQSSEVQTYGYLEENNTVYTIMEFVNDSNIAHYLQNNLLNESIKEENKEEIILPPIVLPSIENSHKKDTQSTQKSVEIEEAIPKEVKKPKSYIFLKILSVAVLIMAALAYYSWDMIQKDKQRAKEHKIVSVITEKTPYTPPLNDRERKNSVKKEKEPIKKEAPKIEEKKEPIEKKELIEKKESKSEEKNKQPLDASYIEEEQEFESEDDRFDIPNEEVTIEEEIEPMAPVEQENNNFLGKRIGGETKKSVGFNRMSVKRFLDQFLASSKSGTIDEIVAQYDSKVDRYFSLKNVNHNRIRKDKINYHKRWTKRDFRLLGFKIISIYRKGNFDYCDIATNIEWNVSSDNSKKRLGRSKGRMTLKRTNDGFKVTSVYTVK